jgi:diphthine-ammonia ligase
MSDVIPPHKIHSSSLPLNVICLISGGKDSFYSLMHCLRNGHTVVAIANLYPPAPAAPEAASAVKAEGQRQGQRGQDVSVPLDEYDGHDDPDLNSHMYQTAGHTILPFYDEALSIPLYRAPILGGAVDKGRYYSLPPSSSDAATEEETESLIPLLRRVMEAHPEANALSAGAILSTYQRTRIESVAVRLGLTPLAYLWQYPSLPWGEYGETGKPDTMLDHMATVGLVARIVKVASGGLDEGLLWGDVVGHWNTRARVKKGVGRFGGSVLGEGGEYETIVFDGPPYLFKGRIHVEEDGRIAVRGQGGENWLWLDQRKTVVDSTEEREDAWIQAKVGLLRIILPNMLDQKFMNLDIPWSTPALAKMAKGRTATTDGMWLGCLAEVQVVPLEAGSWYLSNLTSPGHSAKEQMEGIVSSLQSILSSEANHHSLTADSVAFTTILLRSMPDFAQVNGAYAKLFTKPNPPARVTVACGDMLPPDALVMVSFVLDIHQCEVKEGLHVQSRSYWAPANIGPYSQAISVSTQEGVKPDLDSEGSAIIYVAGQIPLIPNSMEVLDGEKEKAVRRFVQETEDDGERVWASLDMIEEFFWPKLVLSLQHLWRIGTAMKVDWWVGAVSFVVGDWVPEKVSLARFAWDHANWRGYEEEKMSDSTDEEDPAFDVWYQRYGVQPGQKAEVPKEHILPNYDVLQEAVHFDIPHLTVQVDALPRECSVEWQAFGVRTKKIGEKSEELLGGLLHVQALLFDGGIFSFYEISNSCSEEELQSCFQLIQEVHQELESSPKGGVERQHATIYTAGRGLQWAPPGQLIPCRSVWGRRERRLACAMVVRREMEGN